MPNTKTQKDILNLLEQRKFNPNYVPPPDQICFTIDNKVIATLGNYCVISGLPKNGKSLFTTAAIASFIKGLPIFKMRLQFDNKSKIALFDTESGKTTFYKHTMQIKEIAGVNEERLLSRLDAYRLRGYTAQQIKSSIEAYVAANPTCRCCVVDGLLDLIINFNDITESKALSDWLKDFTERNNLLLIVIVHLGRKENMTLGHIGAFADRYAQSTLKVEKNAKENTFELSASMLRESDDFTPINIRRGDDGMFYDAEVEPSTKQRTYKDWTRIEHLRNAAMVMKEVGQKYNELVNDVKERFAIGVNAAKTLIKMWVDDGIIYKNHDGFYKQNVKS